MDKQLTSVHNRFSAVMSTCNILSAILVVWIHAYNIEVYSDSNRAIYWFQDAISQGIARGAVPFFLMSSAFFLYSKDKRVSDVYRSRGQSVLLPYLLWNIVYMLIFAVLRRLSLTGVGMDVVTVENVLSGLFLHKYNYTYWFMRDLIVLVALYPLIRWILRRGKVVAFAFWGLLCVVVGFDVALLESGVYYVLGAIIGYFYADQAERTVEMSGKKRLGVILALLAVSGTLFGVWYGCEFLIIATFRDLFISLLLFFVVSGLNLRINGKLVALSFMIYSLHPLILEIVEKLIYLYFPHTDLWMMVDYVVAPVICLSLVVAICFVWRKLLPRMYKVFNGGRI